MARSSNTPHDMGGSLHRGKLFGALGGGVVLIVILMIIFSGDKAPQGTILYGICNTFLEQNVPYPESLQRKRVDQYPRGVRIYYTQIDPFGQHKLEMIECAFVKNDRNQIILETVLHNRAEIEQNLLDKFNPTIPIILSTEINLDLPRPQADFRRQLVEE